MKIGERLHNLTMARNNQNNNPRSLFAESAYAHAVGSSTLRHRRHQENEDDLLYYEDDTVDQAHSNIVHAELQPLAGASVVIIANTSKYDKVTNAPTLKLMEERESIGCAVESLGGIHVSTLDDNENRTITHAIWIATDEDQQTDRGKMLSHLSSETLVKLNTCLTLDIPVVSSTWLMKIGELSPGQHWSEVDVEDHIPMTIKMFNDVNSGKIDSSAPAPINSALGSSTFGSSRRDAAASLNASISETYENLMEENPDVMEEDALKRAMELSMLDFALVHRIPNNRVQTHNKNESPHQILRVEQNASQSDIKNAYRRRALETHPDKGGDAGEFAAVARAYRVLLNIANSNGLDDRDDGEIILKSTAHWDSELKEHRNLVRELYQNHGQDIADNLQRQNFTLERLGLCHKEAGSSNRNEKDELIRNSCFYLSLALSYLSGIGALEVCDKHGKDIHSDDNKLLREADDALLSETALQLKRVIEAAVLSAHPEWAAKGMVGEEVQAFSDFLVYILESQTIISDWAVVVFDTSSGFVDIYKGQNYKEEEEGVVDESYAASNTLTLRFVPGHYQPLVAVTQDSARPSLKQIISVLEECGVLYVVTDGSTPE